jgi:hypothetical protein
MLKNRVRPLFAFSSLESVIHAWVLGKSTALPAMGRGVSNAIGAQELVEKPATNAKAKEPRTASTASEKDGEITAKDPRSVHSVVARDKRLALYAEAGQPFNVASVEVLDREIVRRARTEIHLRNVTMSANGL